MGPNGHAVSGPTTHDWGPCPPYRRGMSASIERPGIAVGVDGSPASRVAVDWAARDAAMRNVPLILVHVANGVVASWSRTPLPTGFGKWQQERGRQFIDDAIRVANEATNRTGGVQVRTETYYSAVVPTLVDIDGSPVSELATKIAFDEASRRHVELIALHAWSDTRVLDFPGMDWSTMRSSEDEVLAERLAGWQERYPAVKVDRRIVCDRPARQLIERSEAAQLVVVGSRGRGGFAGMLLGSVSSAVVQSARMPVIVARQ